MDSFIFSGTYNVLTSLLAVVAGLTLTFFLTSKGPEKRSRQSSSAHRQQLSMPGGGLFHSNVENDEKAASLQLPLTPTAVNRKKKGRVKLGHKVHESASGSGDRSLLLMQPSEGDDSMPWTRIDRNRTRKTLARKASDTEMDASPEAVPELALQARMNEQSNAVAPLQEQRQRSSQDAPRFATPSEANHFGPSEPYSTQHLHDAEVLATDEEGFETVRRTRGKALPNKTLPNASIATQSRVGNQAHTLTKKQKDNQRRRETKRLDKLASDELQATRLANHRTLQNSSTHSGRKLSGGMTAIVDSKGHMSWDD